jgi:hypothetical protein
MEEWEEAEWNEREHEIATLQAERLDILKRAIDARENESERMAVVRLERLRAGRLAEKQRSFAVIQQRRVKQLRKLGASRRNVFESSDAQTIIDDYASFASTVYAPVTREGKFPDTRPRGQEIDPKPFEPTTFHGILSLEASMPASAMAPKVVTAETKVKKGGGDAYARRKETVLKAELNQVYHTLEDAKTYAVGERGMGACWPAPLAAAEEEATMAATMAATGGMGTTRLRPVRRAERPETPSLALPMEAAAGQHRAVVLLQRLLRGRASQNEMFEGKERRIELIQELQVEASEGDSMETVHRYTIDKQSEAAGQTSAAAAATTVREVGAAAIEMLKILSTRDAGERASLLAASDAAQRRAEVRELDSAAARIQAVQRGRTTRAAAASKAKTAAANGGLPDVASFDAEDQARVLKIQAAARGRVARRDVAARRMGNPEHPNTTSEFAAAEAADPLEAAGARGAEMDAAFIPDLSALSADDQKRIVQMQASARGYLARKQLSTSRQAQRNSGGATPPVLEVPDDLSAEDTSAIIALQASVRALNPKP